MLSKRDPVLLGICVCVMSKQSYKLSFLFYRFFVEHITMCLICLLFDLQVHRGLMYFGPLYSRLKAPELLESATVSFGGYLLIY